MPYRSLLRPQDDNPLSLSPSLPLSLSLCVCVCVQYLDAQQIENLTSYLKALHDEGLAKSDHTTLLLNCYTKLADSKKLEEFIKVSADCISMLHCNR